MANLASQLLEDKGALDLFDVAYDTLVRQDARQERIRKQKQHKPRPEGQPNGHAALHVEQPEPLRPGLYFNSKGQLCDANTRAPVTK